MHLLVAAHDFYPDMGAGGTGRYIYETSRRFVERGHRVSVVTRQRGGEPSQETISGVDVYRYDLAVAGEWALPILAGLPSAWRAVRAHVQGLSRPEPPDLVSFQGLLTPVFVDEAVPNGVPRVTTFHSPWPTEYAIRTQGAPRSSSLRRWLNIAIRRIVERHCLARSDAIVTLSGYMAGQLRSVHGSRYDAMVIPGGVDTDRFTPDAGRYEPIDVDGLTFLTVRRLMNRMGHRQLFEAFTAINDDFPDARLFIGGDGPMRHQLERRAAHLGIASETTFLGYIPDDALPAAYATADVFVLPTQELEGFGLATLEALASGTPVIATPVGGTVEVLSGLQHRLPADPLAESTRGTALVHRMGEWARLEPAVRKQAGECCREYVCEQYDWERTVSELLAEYGRTR